MKKQTTDSQQDMMSSSFERRQGDTSYENFIYNYLLGGGNKDTTLQTVSSQYTLEKFFTASPIYGGGTSNASET